MYSQGISPGLDFSQIDDIRRTAEHCNQLPVHPRHPYVGELVYTSFSGSHQDAIRKAFAQRKDDDAWNIPYLPIDPKDLGRSYEAVIRVNSQSGKGGIAYLLESEYGLELPRRLQIEFSQVVQRVIDTEGKELSAQQLYALFQSEYGLEKACVQHQQLQAVGTNQVRVTASVSVRGKQLAVNGVGNGPIDAFVAGLQQHVDAPLRVLDYHEHALGSGANALAVSYVEMRVGETSLFGVGCDADIVTASLRAITSGLQRSALARATAQAPNSSPSSLARCAAA